MSSVDVQIEGQAQLAAQLHKLGGPALRRLAKRVASSAMASVLPIAKAAAPVGPTGRLRASLGKLQTTNRRRDAFTARVGTRRDFAYRNASGEKKFSGRGKKRAAALAKGATQDKKTAQQYARVIEFGYDKKGRMRRQAGAAHFLENAITSQQSTIIGTVTSQLRAYVNNPPR